MQLFTKTIATSLTLLLMLAACDGAQRDKESQIKRAADNTPSVTQPNITQPSQDTNNTLAPIGPTPAYDNNDSQSVVKVDAKNAYKLSMTLDKSKYTQYESGILHYSIKELYQDKVVDKSLIDSITFSLPEDTNGRYCKFVDYKGAETAQFALSGEQVMAENNIRVKMGANSGTTEILVKADIKLPDGTTRPIWNTIPVVVIKNKTASITVNPYETKWIKQGDNEGLFVEKYVFHVVDKYGNKAKDGTYLQIGAVVDPKLYTLGYTGNGVINTTGTLKEDRTFTIDNPPADVSLQKPDFDNEDNLVILPNRQHQDPTYLGGWSIDYIKSPTEMQLTDDYTGNPGTPDRYGIDDRVTIGDTSGLTFVIGDEDRLNPCSHTLANAAFYFPDGAKVKDGLVYAELRYQPYLVGKTIFVYANAIVDGERIGIAREIHLAGEGLVSQSVSCKNDSNVTKQCTLRTPMVLNGYQNMARYVTPSVEIKDTSGLASVDDISHLNTQCTGRSEITVSILPGKSVTATFGDAIIWETIQNR